MKFIESKNFFLLISFIGLIIIFYSLFPFSRSYLIKDVDPDWFKGSFDIVSILAIIGLCLALFIFQKHTDLVTYFPFTRAIIFISISILIGVLYLVEQKIDPSNGVLFKFRLSNVVLLWGLIEFFFRIHRIKDPSFEKYKNTVMIGGAFFAFYSIIYFSILWPKYIQ